jgi:hypothetical protein
MKPLLSNFDEKAERVLEILRKNDKFLYVEDIHVEIIKQKFPISELIAILKYLSDNNEIIKKLDGDRDLFKKK